MKLDRRSLLAGSALFGLAEAAPSPAAAQPAEAEKGSSASLKTAAVYVPGYMPEYAYANGKPLDANRRFTRAIKDKDKIKDR